MYVHRLVYIPLNTYTLFQKLAESLRFVEIHAGFFSDTEWPHALICRWNYGFRSVDVTGKMCGTTATSFESVMCFQRRNDLWVSWPRDFLNIWMWKNDFFSTLTDLFGFIWLFAAKLCYRHMLKTAPEVKAKLGDDLEVFRPARWIASEASEFLEQQNSKDLFFKENFPENSGFCDLSDIWQILIVYSFPPGHREMSTIRLTGFWPWCSYMLGQATGRLWRALGHCSGAICKPRVLHF